MPSPPHDFDRRFLRALRLSFLASRGGAMRARIIFLLITKPLNTQEIANALKIDYKTALYHLEKMQKEGWLLRSGEGYGSTFKITFTPDQLGAFHALAREMGESLKPKAEGVE